jgi:hypothetical protein
MKCMTASQGLVFSGAHSDSQFNSKLDPPRDILPAPDATLRPCMENSSRRARHRERLLAPNYYIVTPQLNLPPRSHTLCSRLLANGRTPCRAQRASSCPVITKHCIALHAYLCAGAHHRAYRPSSSADSSPDGTAGGTALTVPA